MVEIPEPAQEQPQEQAQEQAQEQSQEENQSNEVISEQPAVSEPPANIVNDLPVISKEERVEFRDENGRVLDPNEVEALQGEVSFKTRYETRTRVVDSDGNEIMESLVDAHEVEESGVAPPHPDVEGRTCAYSQAQLSDAQEQVHLDRLPA